MLVAAVLKHTDVVLKDICQVFAIFLTSFISFVIIREAYPTPTYALALVAVVGSSVFLGGYASVNKICGEKCATSCMARMKKTQLIVFALAVVKIILHFTHVYLDHPKKVEEMALDEVHGGHRHVSLDKFR